MKLSRRDTDFLLRFTQCGRNDIGIGGVTRTARKAYLSTVLAQRLGTASQQHMNARFSRD